MFRYSWFLLSIHSEIELPGLPPGGPEPDVIIRLGSVPRTGPYASVDEEIAINDLAGRFHMRQGCEIVVDPAPGADPALLRVVLAGRMMAFLLRQRGWLPLHASGILLGGQAVLFLGASGTGKSTTAAAFHARGHQVITDDVAPVRVTAGGECILHPAGPVLRLREDSRSVFGGTEPRGDFQWDKHVFDLSRNGRVDLAPVRFIYLLEDGESLRQELIIPLSAATVLSRVSFTRHGRMTKEALAVHLRDCSAVASAVPVFRLARRRSLAALPELVQWIERRVGASGGTAGK
jgi:hypothetical protein